MIAPRRKKPRKPVQLATANTVAVDDTLIKFAKYIDGSSWTIDYYSQLTGSDDTIQNLDTNLPVSEQHYQKFNKLIVTLDEAISTTPIEGLTGSFIYTQAVTPQLGDLLTSSLISGDKALFAVTSVEPLNYSLDTIYNVTFNIVTTDILDNGRLLSLENSVTREYHFVDDALFTEGKQLLISNDYDALNRLKKARVRMLISFDNLFGEDKVYIENGKRVQAPFIVHMYNNIVNDFKIGMYKTYDDGSKEWVEQFFKVADVVTKNFTVIHNKGIKDKLPKLREYIPHGINTIVSLTDKTPELTIVIEHANLPSTNFNDTKAIITNQSSLFDGLMRNYLNGLENDTASVLKLVEDSYDNISKYYYYMFFILLLDSQMEKLRGV